MTRLEGNVNHPEDGAWVRLIDGESAPSERAALEAHLSSCAACTTRLRTLEARSRRVGGAVSRLAPPRRRIRPGAPFSPPARDGVRAGHEALDASPGRADGGVARGGRGGARAWMRAAAAVALLVLAATGVRPVRAWIAERWQAFVEWTAGADAVPAEAAPDAGPDVAVSFVPRDPTFTIEFAAAPDAGRVVVQVVDAWHARADVVDGPDAELLIRPDGLRIENEGADRARYHIAVPAGTRRVEIFVAGRRVAVRSAPAAPDTVVALDFGAGS